MDLFLLVFVLVEVEQSVGRLEVLVTSGFSYFSPFEDWLDFVGLSWFALDNDLTLLLEQSNHLTFFLF